MTLLRSLKNTLISIFILPFLTFALCVGLFLSGFFASWQNKLSDALFWPRQPDSRIVIIAIDDKSIAALGRWPWDRAIHAKLLDVLGDKPAAIGFDVNFSESSKDDAEFEAAIEKSKRVVLTNDSLAQFKKKAAGVGNVELAVDPDGVVRKIGDVENSFAGTIFSVGAAREPPIVPLTAGLGNGHDRSLRINFVGPPGTFPVFSFSDVLSGRIPAKKFRDKIVLIGATAPDLHDTVIAPGSGAAMSGVEAHANIIQNLLSAKFLQNAPQGETMAAIFLTCFAVAAAMALFRLPPAIFVTFVLLVSYVLFAIASFDRGVIRHLVFPPLGLLLSFAVQLLFKYFTQSREKRFIRQAFERYVAPEILNELIAHPEKLTLGGERRLITVLFSDIAGFTSISEKLAPAELANLLNRYLTAMTDVIMKNQGLIDKFIGDAVMAFWNAPLSQKDHAVLAVAAASAMQNEAKRLGLETRIGVHTGEAVIGNFGSASRFDYTAVGDTVNLASRLEGINKIYGTKIIVSEATRYSVPKMGFRLLDTVAVKGKQKGVKIYELGAHLSGFESARALYEKGNFQAALKQFEQILKSNPKDKPTQLYISRCRQFLKNPPANWDGVFRATSK